MTDNNNEKKVLLKKILSDFLSNIVTVTSGVIVARIEEGLICFDLVNHDYKFQYIFTISMDEANNKDLAYFIKKHFRGSIFDFVDFKEKYLDDDYVINFFMVIICIQQTYQMMSNNTKIY